MSFFQSPLDHAVWPLDCFLDFFERSAIDAEIGHVDIYILAIEESHVDVLAVIAGDE